MFVFIAVMAPHLYTLGITKIPNSIISNAALDPLALRLSRLQAYYSRFETRPLSPSPSVTCAFESSWNNYLLAKER